MKVIWGVLVSVMLVSAAAHAQSNGVREVSVDSRSVVPIHAKIRYTTMVILPEGEEILDVVCGDKDFWVISATHNIAHIKPAKEGAATNLNLVTASGLVYSFLLKEGPSVTTDLKVIVTSDTPTIGKAKYVPVAQVDALEAELASARAAVDLAHSQKDQAVTAFKAQYPADLRFPYHAPLDTKPFLLRAIWHDQDFTYLKVDGREKPALYEVVEGKPSLLNFTVKDGTYIVPKILDKGYLALGKERLEFVKGAEK